MNQLYYLYAKWPGQKIMRPVNWKRGERVVNLIHATRFTEEDRPKVEADLAHPDNAGIVYEWRALPEQAAA
jgi:hypothetical protein